MSRSKVKGHGHQLQISSPLKMSCNALAANNVTQQQTDHSVAAGGGWSAQRGCVRFMFGKTSLALVLICGDRRRLCICDILIVSFVGYSNK